MSRPSSSDREVEPGAHFLSLLRLRNRINMTRLARAYIVLIAATGVAILAYGVRTWTTDDLARYLFYLAISTLASGMKVTVSAGAGTMSMNFLFILLGVELLSLGETLLMGCVGILVQRFFHANHRPSPVQVVFNVAAMAVSIGAAYGAYQGGLWVAWFERPILMLIAAGAFFLANTLSVAIVIGLTEQKSIWGTWKQSYFWSFPNYLVGAAVACVLSEISRVFGWQSTLLTLPVLFVLYRSYRLHIDKLEAQARSAEQQRQHAEQLAALHRRTIETLALAIEAKDQTTHDHLARVEVYALEIGRELGLNEGELKALEAAALLHDIGKLAVPEYIISKPGKLTPEEFEKMKIHPVVGAELIDQIEFPYPVAPIVRAHHEKWDGSGYPDGVSGEDIPIGARILSAVDCLDALATDRQYRRALPLPEALGVVQKEAGKAFDPRVVEVLARRYADLEQKAKSSALAQRTKLSTDIKIKRGAAPGAGFEQRADSTSADLANLRNAVQISPRRARAEQLGDLLQNCEAAADAFAALREHLPQAVPYQVMVVYKREDECLVPEFLDGEGQQQFSHLRIPLGMGLAGWVAENHKAIVNGNPSVEPGYLNDPSQFSTFCSALAVPVEFSSGPPGVLSLYRRDRDAFRAEEMYMLQAVATKLGRALELSTQPR